MATPNISEIVASTLESRRGEAKDNVSDSNAVFHKLHGKGNDSSVEGGRLIYEEFNFAENPNGGWYSGSDPLPMAASDVLSGAEFGWKQYAVGVVINGLEELQNSGKERKIKLLANRVKVAQATMKNALAAGLWSDGTGSGGKQLTGLVAAIPVDPTTGTYGAINRANWTFWRSYKLATGGAPASATIQGHMNTAWVNLVRGTEHPDLILADNVSYAAYLASLQANQRFTDPALAKLGFTSVKFMQADVVLDGGIGGNATANTMLFINSDYLFLRSHTDRDMVALDPSTRSPFNQDVKGQILAWAGNLTCSGAQFQGRITFA